MKLTNARPTSHRRTSVFGQIGGAGLHRLRFTRNRLARLWPEDGERMVTPADLRPFNLQI